MAEQLQPIWIIRHSILTLAAFVGILRGIEALEQLAVAKRSAIMCSEASGGNATGP